MAEVHEAKKVDGDSAGGDKTSRPPRPERSVSTTQKSTIDGKTYEYTATAGTLNLLDDKGKERASVFHVSYVASPSEQAPPRPVTFCFNGGPGSSAVWLQLGVFGPRRVDMPDATTPPPPPYRLVDNAYGLLDQTDLVFIDPVGTGFSRPLGEAKDEEFRSVEGDASSVGAFIERWISENGRWNSAKYIAGESYGTTRAAALAHHLQQKGIFCNGVILVSLALDFGTFVLEPGNDLPCLLYLPSFAATAWYHGRLPDPPASLEALLAEARTYAIETYAPALLQGSRLDAGRKRQVARDLARFTGLDAEVIESRNLRIEYLWFAKQLLGQQGRTVGRLDSRFVGDDPDRHALSATTDPSYEAPYGPYAALINDYLRREIGWKTTDSYEVISMQVNQGWAWNQGRRLGYPHVAEDLRKALLGNPHLKVLIANGIYDLATPFFAAEHTADHLDLDPALRGQIEVTSYEAGHMMYLHQPSLAKMRADLVRFYGSRG